MKEKERKKLRKWCKKFFDDDDKDFKTFDFDSEIDDTLTYEENQTILREKINEFIKILPKTKKDAEVMSKEEHRILVTQQLEKVEKPFLNPRNAAACSILQLYQQITATRPL